MYEHPAKEERLGLLKFVNGGAADLWLHNG